MEKVEAMGRVEVPDLGIVQGFPPLPLYFGRRTGRSHARSNFVVLSSDKTISRKHAKLYYAEARKRFEIKVYGKNGVYVGEDLYLPEGPHIILQSGTSFRIGDCTLNFFAEASNVNIQNIAKSTKKSKRKRDSSADERDDTLVIDDAYGLSDGESRESAKLVRYVRRKKWSLYSICCIN
jgi:pSer/pThr/pTyr-binding forkhead associated (FHA) protein